MIPVARRMIWNEKTRFLITVIGVAFTVMLMLFLIGTYEGVKDGSTSYVLNSPAEVWVCQKNSTNLLRSSSFLHSALEDKIKQVNEAGEVTGILRVIATAQIRNRSVTLFVFGFDPKSELGAPATLVQGTSVIGPGEIIIDKSFAAKHRLAFGDSLEIQGWSFKVSGISSGTNAVVAQFAFTTLEAAQRLLGLSDIISFCLIRSNEATDSQILVESLRKRFSSLAVFTKGEFIQNNLEEMETGVLPLLWTIAIFGAVVGIAVITIMLYSSILEKREDYALLKAIGAGNKYLRLLVVQQSLYGTLIGFICGFLLNVGCTPLLIALVPEISLSLTWQAAVGIFTVSLLMGAIGAWAPIHKVMNIYPAEVFRA